MPTVQTTLLESIRRARYRVSVKQVEEMAALQYRLSLTNARADSTYLRIMLVDCQQQLGGRKESPRGRSPGIETMEAVIDQAHERLYPAVLRGVTTPEIEVTDSTPDEERSARLLERNRRANFARSAKSTLKVYVRAELDLRTVDPGKVTKAWLRDQAAEAAGESGPKTPAARAEARIKASIEALMRSVLVKAKGDGDTARERIERVVEDLKKRAAALPDKTPALVPMNRRAVEETAVRVH